MKLILKLLAPYFAVGIFWCIFSNAWFAILAYHAQIVLWLLQDRPRINKPYARRYFVLAVPTILAGGMLYFLLPYITRADLATWLDVYHLSHRSLIVMIPYLGLVHTFLEQLHWSDLRKQTAVSHILFAGYHMLVLYSLLTTLWLVACFFVLLGASFAWQQMQKQSGSIWIPYISHALADTGIIVAVLLATCLH